MWFCYLARISGVCRACCALTAELEELALGGVFVCPLGKACFVSQTASIREAGARQQQPARPVFFFAGCSLVLARFWRALVGLHLVSLPCSVFLELFGYLAQFRISARRSLALVCRSASRVAGPCQAPAHLVLNGEPFGEGQQGIFVGGLASMQHASGRSAMISAPAC